MKIKSPIVNYNNSMSIVYANHPMKDLHIATTSTTTFCNPKSISLFGNGLDVDINSIKELLLNRVPESCV